MSIISLSASSLGSSFLTRAVLPLLCGVVVVTAEASEVPETFSASFSEALEARPERSVEYLRQALEDHPVWAVDLLVETFEFAEDAPETTYDLVYTAVSAAPDSSAKIIDAAREARLQHELVIEEAARKALGYEEMSEELVASSTDGKGKGNASAATQESAKDVVEASSAKGVEEREEEFVGVPVLPSRDFYQPTVLRPFTTRLPDPEEPTPEEPRNPRRPNPSTR